MSRCALEPAILIPIVEAATLGHTANHLKPAYMINTLTAINSCRVELQRVNSPHHLILEELLDRIEQKASTVVQAWKSLIHLAHIVEVPKPVS